MDQTRALVKLAYDWILRQVFFTAKTGAQATVVKGKPEKSPLYLRLITSDEEEVMPPPESHKTLKPAQIAMIKAWILEGAPWQPHWSLIKPERVPLPVVKLTAWVKTPSKSCWLDEAI